MQIVVALVYIDRCTLEVQVRMWTAAEPVAPSELNNMFAF